MKSPRAGFLFALAFALLAYMKFADASPPAHFAVCVIFAITFWLLLLAIFHAAERADGRA